MDTRTFINQFGAEEAERVAREAGTTLTYFRQLANCHRRPSVKLAQKLVSASAGRLDLVSLLTATREDPSDTSQPTHKAA